MKDLIDAKQLEEVCSRLIKGLISEGWRPLDLDLILSHCLNSVRYANDDLIDKKFEEEEKENEKENE